MRSSGVNPGGKNKTNENPQYENVSGGNHNMGNVIVGSKAEKKGETPPSSGIRDKHLKSY